MDRYWSGLKKYRVLQLASILVLVVTAMSLLTGMTGRTGFEEKCPTGATDCVILSYKDFTPNDGSYTLKSTGQQLTYANTDRFTVDIRLDRPAPVTFSRDFKIQEDRWYGWHTLGRLTATFTQGTTQAAISYSRQCCGATAYPPGAPATLTDGTIWIGCTKKDRVKANGEKSGNREASIRLEKVLKSDGVDVKGKFSPFHVVKCP